MGATRESGADGQAPFETSACIAPNDCSINPCGCNNVRHRESHAAIRSRTLSTRAMLERMDEAQKGQVVGSAAEVYEKFFVPALFQQWCTPMVEAADVRPGDQVLDVACGTGVLARAAHERVGSEGRVVGVDLNDSMLAVARRNGPQIEFVAGTAEALEFETASFDAVVSQFGLMFFENPEEALQEMVRMLRPGGRLAVAVWGGLDETPGYAAMVALLRRLFGDEVADALRAPFCLGDRRKLGTLFERAGTPPVQVRTADGWARFPSIAAWVHTDIRGWTLADMIDDTQYVELLAAAELELARFTEANGQVRFPAPANIATLVNA